MNAGPVGELRSQEHPQKMMLELTLENMGEFVAKRREGVREPGKSKGDQMPLWRKRVAVAPSSGWGSCSCQSRWGFCRRQSRSWTPRRPGSERKGTHDSNDKRRWGSLYFLKMATQSPPPHRLFCSVTWPPVSGVRGLCPSS